MSIIFDLIVVGIIALFTFLGYRQGLVKAAIKILSFFIAIIVALTIYKPVSSAIVNNTSIDDNIKSAIVEKIGNQDYYNDEEGQIKDSLTNKVVVEVNNTIDETATLFSVRLIEIATLLLIYIFIKIALKFITVLADLIAKLPLIKQINKLRRNNIWCGKRFCYSLCNISNSLFNITYDKSRKFESYR